MGDFIKRLKGVKRELIILSIALILLGILLILFPETSVNLLCRGIGIALCVWGVLRLMSYFKSAGTEILGSFGLVQGVTLLAFGVFFVMRPEIIALFFTTAIGIVIIVDGILKLQYAMDFYHLNADMWWLELIGAAIMIILGIVAVINPFGTVSTLMIFAGAILVVEGIWDLVSILRISKFAKDIKKEL